MSSGSSSIMGNKGNVCFVLCLTVFDETLFERFLICIVSAAHMVNLEKKWEGFEYKLSDIMHSGWLQ